MAKKITINTPEEIEAMRRVGAEAADLLDFITPYVKAGVSTLELDNLMLDYTVNVLKAKSACLGYNPGGGVPYPRATCISVNNVICHGIPSEKKILKKGDIVNIDVTIVKDGFFGDNSRMFIVGQPTIAGKRLVEATWGCMWAGIETVRPGNCFNDIGIRQAPGSVDRARIRRPRHRARLSRRAARLPRAHHRSHSQVRAGHDLYGRTHGQRGQAPHHGSQ